MPPCSEIRPELGQERRRERVARLAAQVDDLHRRHRSTEPCAELEPLEPLPALRPRRRAPVDGDGTLERGPLRRDRARVVARVGLLLVGGVVLLVDADQAEARHRREDGRARSDDHRRLARDDPLALVAPLGLGQPRVEHGDPVAEASLEAPERLRRERDLGDEHDRAPASLERGGARLEIDLGLAAARSPRRAGDGRRRRRAPRRSARSPSPAARSAAPAPPRLRARPRSRAARLGGRAASAPRARARAPESSRSSRPPRARDRRAPAAARRGPTRSAPSRSPAAPRLPSRRRRRARRRGRSGSRRPRPSRRPSGTSYVNGRATAREETSG